jgi:2-oxoglutarate dehydrogenase E2 component (dihydrolipoamide succinyltransferase)
LRVDIEIKVPSLGESESEATLVAWHKQVGDSCAEDDVLAEVESDKITMEVTATASGTLKRTNKRDGDTVLPGEVIGLIEAGPVAESSARKSAPKPAEGRKKKDTAAAKPAVAGGEVTLAAKRVVQPVEEPPQGLVEERVPMSTLRRTIARRLKEAQNTAAILTTFNEVNMQPVMELRTKYREAFKARHGVDLGFMSFFVRASIEGLKRFPAVNACIDGDDIIYRNHFNIGVAVSTDKGLVVPVIRDAGSLGLADIERAIADHAAKAREGGLLPDDLKGGTFSISNGGVFGSLLSTPILNPPQSAILGMHKIQKRPVAEGDAVVIRPMMYLALSYDHRLIDGREAVQFLVTIKEALEYPAAMLLGL